MINGDDNVNTFHIFKKLTDRKPSLMDGKKFKKYAILIPLVEIEGEIHLLFEVRSLKMRSQPGDVCFPGGRVDQDDASIMQSAVRETTEELGVNASTIKHIYPLDYFISNDRRLIYPFVGKLTNLNDIDINQEEVHEIFTVPLSFFTHTEPKKYKINFEVVPERNFPYELIQNGENYEWRTREMDELFYVYGERVIWGLTAKIISHFMEVIRTE